MSELNKLKVVDFTAGRLSSDDINTNIPFRDNLAKTRTIQQANAVIGAYVNRNYTDMQNKADKDEIPTKVSELENDEGYITTGDIPSKTSDLTNDGADGEHPFITKEVNNLTNYTNTNALNDELDIINVDIDLINTNIQRLSNPISLLDYTSITQGTDYTLSDDITNYRYIIVQLSTASNEANSSKQYIPVSLITAYDNTRRTAISLFQSTTVYIFGDFYFSASNKIRCNTYTHASWNAQLKVWGIK